MAYINEVLDAEDEVTTMFTSEEIGGQGHFGTTLHVAMQGSRTTSDSGNVIVSLDTCMINEDGTLHQMHNGTELVDAWFPTVSNFFVLNSTRNTYMRVLRNQVFGLMYRLRYSSNGTTPIRLVVATPFRSED